MAESQTRDGKRHVETMGEEYDVERWDKKKKK